MSLLALSTLTLLNLACTAEEEAGGMGGGGIANEINQPNSNDGQQGGDDLNSINSGRLLVIWLSSSSCDC